MRENGEGVGKKKRKGTRAWAQSEEDSMILSASHSAQPGHTIPLSVLSELTFLRKIPV